jgi:predicted transport protein
MKHVLENHGDNAITTQELEVTVQGPVVYISARDYVNFDDVVIQSDKVINVDIRLSVDDIDDLINVLKLTRDKIENTPF